MKYTTDHEWLDTSDAEVAVGITAYAATQLGDIVYVELPEVDTEVAKGDEVA
ncbi:MAG: glycine cleavage system protein H, partial [Propionibacterium sp.]